MGKARATLACSTCGQQASRWAGRCPGCDAWGTIEERSPRSPAAVSLEPLPSASEPDDRLSTGFEGLDRVLGGGLVPGSVVLVAGEPGIGKSTLLLQALARLGAAGRTCLLASGEESRGQVGARARRLGLPDGDVSFTPGRDLHDVLGAAQEMRPDVLVVDSIQAIRDPEQGSLAGGTAQVRTCADALVGLAKTVGIAVVLAGQVTKDGDVAGPRTLEHAVDTVCSFDGDARTGLRVLAGGKNRFGPEGEVAWFEMDPDGLREVPSRDVLSLSRETGTATALVTAGRRALAIEVQALASSTDGPPRRYVTGLDPRRFGLVAAVVDRLGFGLSRAELYGAAVGGLRVDDPAADLAVAAALASAASGTPPPESSAFVGEVGLPGTVRTAPNLSSRLAAAAAAGITTVFCAGAPEVPTGVRVVRVAHLADALRWAGARKQARGGGSSGTPAKAGFGAKYAG